MGEENLAHTHTPEYDEAFKKEETLLLHGSAGRLGGHLLSE